VKLPELQLTLYSRSYCHLCGEMEADLLALGQVWAGLCTIVLDIIDIDAEAERHPQWLARHDEKVPVLVACRGEEEFELCHYHLDQKTVSAYLAGYLHAFRQAQGDREGTS